MAVSASSALKKKDDQKAMHASQEEWISEEELYTEGSSDEDDMALRVKRRERGEEKKVKPTSNRPQNSHQHSTRLVSEMVENTELKNEHMNNDNCSDNIVNDDSYDWRPIQRRLTFKNSSDPDIPLRNGVEVHNEVAVGEDTPKPSLSEAYSNMHKLDALLRDSDRRLKEAQEETLRAQLSTRAQLRQLRDRGGGNVVLARNWEAFMQLCPATDPTTLGDVDGVPGGGGGAGDQGYSVMPKISGADMDGESDGSESSGSALAITDEERLKLAALLRDVDADVVGVSGYQLDAEARRSLEHIDGKLQELIPELADARADALPSPSCISGVSKGSTRQQRLEDIDRCLHALAASALREVEPVGDEEVRALLQGSRAPRRGGAGEVDEEVRALLQGSRAPRRGGAGEVDEEVRALLQGSRAPRRGGAGDSDEEVGIVDPTLISDLLEEARKELPHFRYRNHNDSEEDSFEALQASQRSHRLPRTLKHAVSR